MLIFLGSVGSPVASCDSVYVGTSLNNLNNVRIDSYQLFYLTWGISRATLEINEAAAVVPRASPLGFCHKDNLLKAKFKQDVQQTN